ncbi:MAG: HEAT repeat domain-containing protein [Blastocatellia bacterium]
MNRKRKLTIIALLAVAVMMIVQPRAFDEPVSSQQSQIAIKLQPQILVTEIAKLTSDGSLITDWPLIRALMNLPESLRRQLNLNDAELAEVASGARDTTDDRRGIRLHVASSLGLAEDAASVRSLTAVLGSSDVEKRRYAAFGLWLIGNEASIAPLIGALQDADESARRHAVLAIGRILEFRHIENRPAINALTAALGHESEQMRREAARALAHAGRPARTAVPALIELFKTDPSEYVRQQAVHGLGHLGENSPVAAETLLTALGDSSGHVRSSAAHSLSDIEKRLALRAIPTLIGLLKHDRLEEVRREAAHALGHIEAAGKETTPALIEALRDQSARVRGEAAFALSNIEEFNLEKFGRAAIPSLIESLKGDVSSEVRRQAAHALGHLGGSSPDAVKALTQAAKDDPVAEVRREAAQALVELEHDSPSDQSSHGQKTGED